MLTAPVAAVLAACVHARLSIVFAGPPGSGKTTLLSCTTAELDPALRVVAEEVFEADIPVPNVAQMQTLAARTDRPAFDLRRLVAGFLRMAPDVAVVVGRLPLAALNTLVSESIDVVVHCTRTPAGPRVIELAMVEDLAGGVEATQFTITEVFWRPRPGQPLAWTGEMPVRAARPLADAGHDIGRLLEARGMFA